MAKSQESPTRAADAKAALTSNSSLQPAITWLRQNTAMSRLSDLEINEVIRDAKNSGLFVITCPPSSGRCSVPRNTTPWLRRSRPS
jgi:hypothetical protein